MRIKRFNESINYNTHLFRIDKSIDYLMESLKDFNKNASLYKYYTSDEGDHYSDFSNGLPGTDKDIDELLSIGSEYMVGYSITIETEFIPKIQKEEHFDSTPVEFSFDDIYDNVKDLNSTFDFTKSFLSDLEGIEYCVGFYNDNIILKIIDLKSKFKYEDKKV